MTGVQRGSSCAPIDTFKAPFCPDVLSTTNIEHSSSLSVLTTNNTIVLVVLNLYIPFLSGYPSTPSLFQFQKVLVKRWNSRRSKPELHCWTCFKFTSLVIGYDTPDTTN